MRLKETLREPMSKKARTRVFLIDLRSSLELKDKYQEKETQESNPKNPVNTRNNLNKKQHSTLTHKTKKQRLPQHSFACIYQQKRSNPSRNRTTNSATNQAA